MNPFWHRVAHVVLPDGYRVWDVANNDQAQEGDIVIQLCEVKSQQERHWWDFTNNATRVKCKTFVRTHGQWHLMGVAADNHGQDGPQWRCITPAAAAQPAAAVAGHCHMAVFTAHLHGPAHIDAGPQELAERWQRQYRGQLVTCDIAGIVKKKIKGVTQQVPGITQGFFVVPSWDAFKRDVWARTPRRLRNFYENIGEDAYVRLFADIDGTDKSVRAMDKAHVVQTFFESVEQAFAECYPNATRKLTRADWYVWDSTSNAKMSLHINTHKGCPLLWRNVRAAKSFMRHVRRIFFGRLLGKEPDQNEAALLDLSVYSSNRKFRLPWCCKRPKQTHDDAWVLTWYPHPGGPAHEPQQFEDMLIVPLRTPANAIIVPEPGATFLLQEPPADTDGTVDRLQNGAYYAAGQGMNDLPPGQVAPFAAGGMWCLQDGPLPIEFAERQQQPQQRQQRQARREAAAAAPSAVDMGVLQQEVAQILGGDVCISQIKPFQGGLSFVTDVHRCPFHNADGSPYEHGRFTQCGYVGRHQWVQWCGDYQDGACRGQRLRHSYRNPQAICALLDSIYPRPAQPAQQQPARPINAEPEAFKDGNDGDDHDDNDQRPSLLANIVRAVFPDHQWPAGVALWECGNYFGPCDNRYNRDYSLSVDGRTLLYRRKRGPRAPVACTVALVPAELRPPQALGDKMTCDWTLYERMMHACDALMGSPGLVRDLERHTIYYYAAQSGSPVASIRYHGAPARIWAATGSRKAAPSHVSEACRAFMRSVRLLPQKPDRDRSVGEWEQLAQRVVVDNGPPEQNTNYALLAQEGATARVTFVVGPPGGGKTEGIVIGVGDTLVAPEIELTANLARRKLTAHYRTEDGSEVRSAQDLHDERGAVTGCTNSLLRALRLRSSAAQWVFDELTASLWAVAGPGNLLGDEQGPAVLAEMERRFRQGQRVFGLGADITPQVEGQWLSRLGIPFDVLIKFNQRSAASVQVLELMCDAELFDLFVRIMCHNARSTPDRRLRVFIHCNTKRMLRRLRALCLVHNPNAAAIFVDSETGVPAEFVADPDAEWVKYEVVGTSPKIKSGVSFKVPNHFDVMLCYATSRTTSTNEVGQGKRRTRCDVSLFADRIVQQGSGGNGDDGSKEEDAKAEAALFKEFCAAHRIPQSAAATTAAKQPTSSSPSYDSLRDCLAGERVADQCAYLPRSRANLRLRDMTIHLGGLARDRSIAIALKRAPDTVITLGPLPAGIDIKGPDDKHARMEAILEADDIGTDRARQLRTSSVRTPEQNAQLERYELLCEWHPWRPLSFEDFVKLSVCKEFAKRVKQCAAVLGPEMGAAAQGNLLLRHNVQSLLALMPDLSLNNPRANDGYALTPRQVQQLHAPLQALLQDNQHLKRFASKAQARDARTVSTLSSALHFAGLPRLQLRKRDRSWLMEFDGSEEALFQYADVEQPPLRRFARTWSVVVSDPTIYEDRIEDPASGHVYRLCPDGAQDAAQFLCVVLVEARPAADETPHFSFRNTLELALRRQVQSACHFTLEWEWFHRQTLWRIVCLNQHSAALVKLLTESQHRHQPPRPFSIVPRHHDDTYCRERRLQLEQTDQGLWRVTADVSRYFGDA